jgi:UDP-glucose 4-epimerase
MAVLPSRPLMRAIVTGGAGFIGSHLVDRLLADGTAVLVLDDLSTGSEKNVAHEARFERIDLADTDAAAILVAWHPDVVFHLAAQTSVAASQAHPLRDLQVNVIGTRRILDAALSAGASRFVYVSSGGAIYGETLRPATERTRPAPASYYGIHKLASEGHVALAGLSYAIARPGNVYGPRQRGGIDGAVVAAFIQQASQSGSLTIYGDGGQTRDFLHVLDAVDALVRLAGEPASGIWNVASGRNRSIQDLATSIESACGHPFARINGPTRPGDIRSSKLSARRLRTTGWRPRIDFRAGIAGLVSAGPVPSPGPSATRVEVVENVGGDSRAQ